MKDNYCKICDCVIAWDDMVQEMEANLGQAAGSVPQVEVHGNANCCQKTRVYLMEHKVIDKLGKVHTQCNCIVLITVQSAEN
jgi:hypothetical protein